MKHAEYDSRICMAVAERGEGAHLDPHSARWCIGRMSGKVDEHKRRFMDTNYPPTIAHVVWRLRGGHLCHSDWRSVRYGLGRCNWLSRCDGNSGNGLHVSDSTAVVLPLQQ